MIPRSETLLQDRSSRIPSSGFLHRASVMSPAPCNFTCKFVVVTLASFVVKFTCQFVSCNSLNFVPYLSAMAAMLYLRLALQQQQLALQQPEQQVQQQPLRRPRRRILRIRAVHFNKFKSSRHLPRSMALWDTSSLTPGSNKCNLLSFIA